MNDHILTLNAGSSSLKFALFTCANLECRALGQIEGLGGVEAAGGAARFIVQSGAENLAGVAGILGPLRDHEDALRHILGWISDGNANIRIVAVGHRVVHGGADFEAPVIASPEIIARLRMFGALAPLHQPHNIAGIIAATTAFPGVPQIACFDTAFHRAHPFIQDTFALPRAFYDEGVRRYGFHGLSYEYVAQRLTQIAPRHAAGRVILCHLGAGASICALRNGHSLTSTMGLSPLDGLPMATRSGQIDPAVLLYLMENKGMDAAGISELLYRQSGLKGLSGISGDMRALESSSEPHAREAIAYFISRLCREIGGMAAVLEGVDALVFSGGIGENSAYIRREVLTSLGWLGVTFDEARNQANAETLNTLDADIGVFVIRTNEELMIARHTRRLIST